MHIKTTEEQLAALFAHKVGASLYVAVEMPTEDDEDSERVMALMLATNAGWLPIYLTFALTVVELVKLDPDAVRVTEIAG